MSMLDEVGTGRLATSTSDVGAARERARGYRLGRVAFVLAVPMLWMWWRIIDGRPFDLTQVSLPTIDPFLLIVGVFFGVMIVTTLGVTLVAGRSPHITYRPEQIDVSLADVKGIDLVKADVVRSLNLFLAQPHVPRRDGRTPAAACSSRALPVPARRTWPRRWRRSRRAVPLRVGQRVPVDVLRRDRPQDPVLLQGAAQGGAPGGWRDRLHRGDRRHRDARSASGTRPRRSPRRS